MARIRPTRRRLLALGSAVALAGCTDSRSDGDETDDEGTEEATDEGAESGSNSSADETATENGGESDSTEIEPESVTFESADGSDVAASVYGDGSCVIVLIPQINMEKESWDDQARALAEDGHLAVPIDPGERRVDAVSGVVTGLREERTVDRVILVGASIGGEAALLAAADEIDVDGVVAISPGGGGDRSGEIDASLLLIVAEGDDDRFVSETERAYDEAIEPKQLLTVEGSEYGQRLFDSAEGSEVTTKVVEFVDRVCREE